MFEYVGEHAQAASLRLEHADTLRDEQQRLAVLREGCARNPANPPPLGTKVAKNYAKRILE